ncbi:CPBP family intramembrane glutamic endopeptidase [Staphylococcus capitis]|uniref:CPBP family intramembrane glutamic endopeptidase n=1 Tax=Staphylococcus capitis TaxID=29388 RepID=UPI00321962C6
MIAPQFLKRLGTFIIGLIVAFLLSAVASFILYLCSINAKYHHLWATIAIIIYVLFIFTIVRIWHSKLRKKQHFTNILQNIIWLIIGILIMLTVYWSVSELHVSTNKHVSYNSSTIIYTFIFYVCFAPVVEEAICRGWFLSLFFKRRSQDAAINSVTIVISCLISSYISTMMHGLTDIITIIPIFMNGCIAAVLYLKSNSILFPIIFHVVINLLAWIAML